MMIHSHMYQWLFSSESLRVNGFSSYVIKHCQFASVVNELDGTVIYLKQSLAITSSINAENVGCFK